MGMYKEKMLSVCTIANGFLIEVRAPFKPEKSEDDEKCCHALGVSYGEKEIYAKDPAALGKLIAGLVPMLQMDFEGESDFEAAFKMAASK